MDNRETAKIMAVLQAAYPRYYHDATEAQVRQAATLWQSMLAEYSYDVVSKAVKALIATEKFVPTVADVIEKIQTITQPPGLGEIEAWALVKLALRDGTYHSAERFDELPESVQAAIGKPEVLQSWALVNVDDIETVVGSNFMRSFRAKNRQTREFTAIPEDVREFMKLAMTKLTMPELESKSENGAGDENAAH